jgi:hypothetical protein
MDCNATGYEGTADWNNRGASDRDRLKGRLAGQHTGLTPPRESSKASRDCAQVHAAVPLGLAWQHESVDRAHCSIPYLEEVVSASMSCLRLSVQRELGVSLHLWPAVRQNRRQSHFGGMHCLVSLVSASLPNSPITPRPTQFNFGMTGADHRSEVVGVEIEEGQLAHRGKRAFSCGISFRLRLPRQTNSYASPHVGSDSNLQFPLPTLAAALLASKLVKYSATHIFPFLSSDLPMLINYTK